MTRYLWLGLLALALAACGEDGSSPQGDGSANNGGANNGAANNGDANNGGVDQTDTDGDGLSDAMEQELGTDASLPDTDEDGYTDFEEVHAGTDPLDAEDRIYTGGWPYNPDKDEVDDPGYGEEPGLGKKLARYKAVDQFGDEVDLYDFLGQGKLVVLDVGTWFCEPCKSLAEFLSTGDPSVMDEWLWWNPDFEVIREMIEEEEIYWITVLFSKGTPVTQEDVARWDETWPNEHIPVLADTDLVLQEYMQVESMPRIDVLDSGLMILSYDDGPNRGIRAVIENR